ncbi:hypothetical protein A9Q87_04630 [Flavobacteriales bacterium 34_180_T64]|nr:hypothetical protein A9Q87_04630 [Flavobacteriales bacterium 34_180_T64]
MITGKPRNTSQFVSELEAFYSTDYYDGVYFDIYRFKQFLIDFENQLLKTNKNIIKELEKEEPDITISMMREPHIDNTLNRFPEILKKNSYITVYAYLEAKLFELIKLIEKHFPKKMTFKDYIKSVPRTKSKVVMMLKYFEDILKLTFDSKKEIDKFENYRFIRECIVHCNSDISISKDKNKIDQIIKKTSELSSNDNIIQINDNSYILQLAELTNELFKKLIQIASIELNNITPST